MLFFILLASPANAAEVRINNDRPVFVEELPFVIRGTATAPAGTLVTVTVTPSPGNLSVTAPVGADMTWQVTWSAPLENGIYVVVATSVDATTSQFLRMQLRGTLPRQSPIEPPPPEYGDVTLSPPEASVEITDRWRIVPPPYELDEQPRARALGGRGATLDPYNKNLLKGDYPIFEDFFLVLTGVSDTLAESRSLPTPSGVSAARPESFPFFGKEDQNFFLQNVIVSGDLFQGDTAFQPVRQRVKATIVANVNHLRVEENAIVKPDVRRGTTRTDGRVSLQELFYERRLLDLTSNFDFLSIRAGSQPFNSDFRGFIFSDTNLGVRLFGNYASNRFQYNLALFDRLEKDTNSGLNTNTELRNQRVAVANFYWQDFLWKGYTQAFSIHRVRDDATLKYDRNGNLVRPAPIGAFTPHEITATYIGMAGLGHIGRINVDHAMYFVFGRDSLNPIAGPDPRLEDRDSVSIAAGMLALEVSYDRDWLRPRLAVFYATGDDKPRDRQARGFDSIFDATAFAGGGFSFFNRLGIRLAGTGVSLVERGSLLPAMRSSKDEGQPNFVNPGLQLFSAGLDVEVTPRLKTILTLNYIRLDATEPIEAVLFQGDIDRELGTDISLGARYRPFLSNNWIIVGGAAGFIPGQGFQDIYESRAALYHVFTNVILTF